MGPIIANACWGDGVAQLGTSSLNILVAHIAPTKAKEREKFSRGWPTGAIRLRNTITNDPTLFELQRKLGSPPQHHWERRGNISSIEKAWVRREIVPIHLGNMLIMVEVEKGFVSQPRGPQPRSRQGLQGGHSGREGR